MGIPLLNDIKALSQPPQRFLVFSALNVFTWFSLVGPVVVLFARKIEMPAAWIGYLLSFFPLSTLLVIITIPLVTRLGSKRLLVLSWLLQSAVAGLVFLVPWAMGWGGPKAGWGVLLAAILGFCLARAAGIGGWFPLLHDIVPPREQNRFFSTEMALAQGCIVVATAAQALILGNDPSVGRFLFINGLGVAAGFVSAFWLTRVSGGESTYDPVKKFSSLSTYRAVFRDRSYLLFVLTTAVCFSCFAWINASIVLYMRDQLGFTDLPIMLAMGAGNLGVLFTIHFWGRFADHSGTGYAALLAMLGHSFAALCYLALPPGASWSAWLLTPVLVCTTLLGAAYWTISHRYMISLVDKEHTVGYTNLWIVGTAIAMGLTPIATGYVIEHLGIAGFRLAFTISGVGGILAGLANFWVVHHRTPIRHALDELVNPMLPVRTLARIAWVTVGLHSSRRELPREEVEGEIREVV